MQIEYTGRQTDVPSEIKTLAERKLEKLGKVLGSITDVHVVFTVDKHRHIADVNVRSPRLTLQAAEESTDLALSLTTVMDKLTRQAQRRLGKLRERKRRAPEKPHAVWTGVLGPGSALEAAAGPASPEPQPEVVRSRRAVVHSMSVAAATRVLDHGDEDLVVFRNSATHRVNILYRRKDGQLGIIEPEV